jgi:hypothetical protein
MSIGAGLYDKKPMQNQASDFLKSTIGMNYKQKYL